MADKSATVNPEITQEVLKTEGPLVTEAPFISETIINGQQSQQSDKQIVEVSEKVLPVKQIEDQTDKKTELDPQNNKNKATYEEDIVDQQNQNKKTLFGIQMSPINPRDLPWENQEKYVILFSICLLVIGLFMGILVSTEAIEFKDSKYIFELPDQGIIINYVGIVAIYWFVMVFPGLLVFKQKVPVELTRKIIHILFHIPVLFISRKMDEEHAVSSHYWKDLFYVSIWTNFCVNSAIMTAFIRPVRKINKLAYWSFHAFDRPSDRPNTLLWLAIQQILVTITNGPYIVWAVYNDYTLLQAIPFCCSGLGDGLAEPIGRMFGKHKYKVKGAFTNKIYSRSYEGSLCVYLMTFLGVCISYPDLTTGQFIFLLTLLPIVQTIVEAKAPHTLDNGFINAICFLFVWFTTEYI